MRRSTLLVSSVCMLLASGIGVSSFASAADLSRATARVLSASWGTDNGAGCPTGEKGLDNLPVTFNQFIDPSSIQVTDFLVIRSDGSAVNPICALTFPPNEPNEAQTINLIGNFGDAVNGPTPRQVRITGQLRGKLPGALTYRPLGTLPDTKVDPLPGPPAMVDAWRLTPALMSGDLNRCQVGTSAIRVVWSNGLTSFPDGQEVGDAVRNSYRAIFRLPNGRSWSTTPLELADLHDHPSAFNSDNMHDLCLGAVPSGAVLAGVSIGAGVIQDPNGDPNAAQRFVIRRS